MIKIKYKECKHILMIIVTGRIIPEQTNKWLNKTICPKCDSINWVKGE